SAAVPRDAPPPGHAAAAPSPVPAPAPGRRGPPVAPATSRSTSRSSTSAAPHPRRTVTPPGVADALTRLGWDEELAAALDDPALRPGRVVRTHRVGYHVRTATGREF